MSIFLTTPGCPAPHLGACDAVLREDVVVATLQDHGFATRIRGGVVESWEPATVFPLDGGPAYDASGWVSVPHEVHALAIWLGY